MNPTVKLTAWWRRRTVLERLHLVPEKRVHERYNRLMKEKKGSDRKAKMAESVQDSMLREQLQRNQQNEGDKVGCWHFEAVDGEPDQ